MKLQIRRTQMHTPGARRLVTVASFSHPAQAWLARNLLADEGISAFVQDEHVVSMYWLYALAVHGVKVQVAADDTVKARALLAESAELAVEPEPDEHDSHTARACKQCGSREVCKETFSKRAVFLSWLLLGIPIPIRGNDWRCFRCGYYDRPASWIEKGLPRQFSLRSLFLLTFIVACVLGLLRAVGFEAISTTGSTKPATQKGY